MKSITSVLSIALLAMAVMFVGCADDKPETGESDVSTTSTAAAEPCDCAKGECSDCDAEAKCCGECEGETCACTDSECKDCEAKDGECCGKCDEESKACACSKGSCEDCKSEAKCCGKCGDKPAPSVPVTSEEAAK